MNAQELLRQEFIGAELQVVSSTNKSLHGLHGKIIDETKSTFTILTEKGEKKIIKNTITIIINLRGKKYKIDGKLMAKRPYERIKIRL